MTFKKLTLIGICLSFFATLCNAQNEQIAYNKKSTTESTMDIILTKHNSSAFELYDDWNNIRCHAKTSVIPNTYKINLKHFAMPINQSIITSNFGKRWGRNHNGVDIKAYHGDTIYSAFSGKVRVVKNDTNGYGNVIVIRHWNGLETVYGHLSKQIVKPNEIVEAGQAIGLAGNTGRSSGTHLHFETRFCGIPINPLEIFSFKNKDITGDFYSWKKK
jgi:murein DD-endopeptidase MepM/ murein hydrolase activator NlpD